MSLVEKINKLTSPSETTEQHPSPAVKRVLDSTSINSLLDEFKEHQKGVEIEQTVLEEGKRVVSVVRWNQGELNKPTQIVISTRDNTMAFIGNTNQFIKLEGNQLSDKELVTTSLAQTIVNPSIVSNTY